MPTLLCIGLGYCARAYVAEFGARFDHIVGTTRNEERAAEAGDLRAHQRHQPVPLTPQPGNHVDRHCQPRALRHRHQDLPQVRMVIELGRYIVGEAGIYYAACGSGTERSIHLLDRAGRDPAAGGAR